MRAFCEHKIRWTSPPSFFVTLIPVSAFNCQEEGVNYEQRDIIYESVENSWRECQKRCLAVETLEKTDFAVACNYWVWNPDTNRRYPRICSLSSGIFSDFFFFFQRNHVDFTSRSRAIFYFTFTSRSRFSVIFISLSFLEKSEREKNVTLFLEKKSEIWHQNS